MYNKENKQKFIVEYTQSKHTEKVALQIFKSLATYEEEADKDVCAMSAEELQKVADNVMGLRQSSKWMSVTILKEYTKWCIENGVVGANSNIESVNLLGLDKIRTQMVANPLHLHKCLDEIFDPESDETMDNLYRCFFWIAYSGLEEEAALLLESDAVNLSRLTLESNGRAYPISREGMPAFEKAVNLTHLAYKHPNYGETILRARVPGNLLLRGVKADAGVATIRAVLSKRTTSAFKNRDTSQRLSYSRVKLSGEFYRASELERAGLIDVEAESSTKKGFLEDYQRWKLAFRV